MTDSLRKIFECYIIPLIKKSITYRNKVYKPLDKIIISPTIFRKIICNKNCGACCLKYTMDFLPHERKPKIKLTKRIFENKEIHTFYSSDKNKIYCDLLDTKTGLCSIHSLKPFSCDFEFVRFKYFKSKNCVYIGNYTYGRAWNMRKINGERGALCESTRIHSEENKKEILRKFKRLKEYIDYFEVDTYINEIIKQLEKLDIYKPFLYKKSFYIEKGVIHND